MFLADFNIAFNVFDAILCQFLLSLKSFLQIMSPIIK